MWIVYGPHCFVALACLASEQNMVVDAFRFDCLCAVMNLVCQTHDTRQDSISPGVALYL